MACSPVLRPGCNPTRLGCNPCVQAATLCASRLQPCASSRLQPYVLPGAQLEDGGVAGTAGCHWEMRWFRDEYMTGSASPSDRARSPQYNPMRPSPHDPSVTP